MLCLLLEYQQVLDNVGVSILVEMDINYFIFFMKIVLLIDNYIKTKDLSSPWDITSMSDASENLTFTSN